MKLFLFLLAWSNFAAATLTPLTSVPNISGIGVSAGNFPGYSIVSKYGRNPDIDTATVPEDLWGGDGPYPGFPASSAHTGNQIGVIIVPGGNWEPNDAPIDAVFIRSEASSVDYVIAEGRL